MTEIQEVPVREKVAVEDQWNLDSLFGSVEEWEKTFQTWSKKIEQYRKFQKTLAGGAENLAACLRFHFSMERTGERLGTYAFLKISEDAGNAAAQTLYGRFMNATGRAATEASFIAPEILAISNAQLKKYREADKLKPYRLWLSRLLEEKPHTLSSKEEKLLAMQTEMAQTAGNVFDQLTDVDMKFGTLRDHSGQKIELSHASFTALLHGPRRSVRKQAFTQFYQVFEEHQNTLAATYAGSVQKDIYHARARNFSTAREASLFQARIPETVYDNLIAGVRKSLPKLHEYYDLRRRMMKLRDIHMYDTYVPILSDAPVDYPWEKGVEMVLEAVRPLGAEYGNVLREGLTSARWCDRYENRGKASGAFSCGSYDGLPYILMNYKSDVLDSVFTLAHEAGHSMHSYYSVKHQPFPYYNYELFVAEVASTFNEQLLHHYLMEHTTDRTQRLNLVNRQIDAIRATIFRQTMFAEFERDVHTAAENGEALTREFFTSTYRRLLEDYFGPNFVLDEVLNLECFRIPHFYRAFYVYQYATGLSAAIALSRRVLQGGKQELKDYLQFLSGGNSRTPLELLQLAGVDMNQPEPLDEALGEFSDLVDALRLGG
ncbi:MAG: oligoendopeptidase F [Planctomycetia bacterium]|nr:oligoendopeptidase F [Planctomycetia bacterium]